MTTTAAQSKNSVGSPHILIREQRNIDDEERDLVMITPNETLRHKSIDLSSNNGYNLPQMHRILTSPEHQRLYNQVIEARVRKTANGIREDIMNGIARKSI